MAQIDHDSLLAACHSGGASVLTSSTELEPAAGPLAGIAPARFVEGRDQGTYAYETRYDGVDAVSAVVVDSKQSAINRAEAALSQAIADSHPLLARTPRLTLTYGGMLLHTDLDVPHRFADGHFRAGTIDGTPSPAHPAYRALRDAHPGNARALLEGSPASLVFGAWDATRRTHQGRYRSALTGEVIGVLADQSPRGLEPPRRGAARTDDIAPSVRLPKEDMARVLEAQEHELSPGNAQNIRKDLAGRGETVSASSLGLGSIPPSLTGLGFVSCRRIVRHHVLSFAALRQLRFGLGTDGDTAARALLAALALNGLARSDAELHLRANCDLRESGVTEVVLDGRQGASQSLEALTIADADALLSQAIDAAEAVGVRWEGQTLDVRGDPAVAGGALADAEE